MRALLKILTGAGMALAAVWSVWGLIVGLWWLSSQPVESPPDWQWIHTIAMTPWILAITGLILVLFYIWGNSVLGDDK